MSAIKISRVAGLDAIRFIAALWVALSHGMAPPLKLMLGTYGLPDYVVAAASGVLFNGVAAVTVFFLISGFCIHLPWVGADHVDLHSHLIRRYIRIGGPLLACYLLMYVTGNHAPEAVLWSIYCELIYYTMYPGLFRLFRRYGIRNVIIAATSISIILIAIHPDYLFPWEFGIYSTWLVCLPWWLLGCKLAQDPFRAEVISLPSIWAWRMIAFAYTVVCEITLFHGPIRANTLPAMLIFSFFCYCWLRRELTRYRDIGAVAFLDWCGTWSYSMYIIHPLIINSLGGQSIFGSYFLGWVVLFFSVLLASYAFYVVVERPSHHLARRVARLWRDAAPAAT